MLEWISKGMRENPSSIIEKANTLIHGDIVKALEKFRTDKHI